MASLSALAFKAFCCTHAMAVWVAFYDEMNAQHVLTTTDSRDHADRLGRLAVDARLAACAQVAGPVTSTYWWMGAVETATEWHVWLKTTGLHLEELIALIRSNHTYEVPEIIAIPITAGNPAYLHWVAEETTPRDS